MSEFIFVHLIDKRPVGTELGEHIPLHTTILHWFEVTKGAAEIIAKADATLQPIGRLATKATYEDLFGPDKDIPVMRLEKTPGLIDLHLALKAAMEGMGATFDERWTGSDKWNPHVTHKLDKRLQPSDVVEVGDIDLITRPDPDGSRRILHRFELSDD